MYQTSKNYELFLGKFSISQKILAQEYILVIQITKFLCQFVENGLFYKTLKNIFIECEIKYFFVPLI